MTDSKVTVEDLYIKKARVDLIDAGMDFDKVEEIAGKLCDIYSQYGDCPEYAVASIAAGYNSKCMAENDSEEYIYKDADSKTTGAISREEAVIYNNTKRKQFAIINDVVILCEESLHEVVSPWRS
tara:strand:- start:348 stop:722 length:375 start_codon:yes stop_codon:yes gene_type:complete